MLKFYHPSSPATNKPTTQTCTMPKLTRTLSKTSKSFRLNRSLSSNNDSEQKLVQDLQDYPYAIRTQDYCKSDLDLKRACNSGRNKVNKLSLVRNNSSNSNSTNNYNYFNRDDSTRQAWQKTFTKGCSSHINVSREQTRRNVQIFQGISNSSQNEKSEKSFLKKKRSKSARAVSRVSTALSGFLDTKTQSFGFNNFDMNPIYVDVYDPCDSRHKLYTTSTTCTSGTPNTNTTCQNNVCRNVNIFKKTKDSRNKIKQKLSFRKKISVQIEDTMEQKQKDNMEEKVRISKSQYKNKKQVIERTRSKSVCERRSRLVEEGTEVNKLPLNIII